jgi:hypothetical protein
MKQKTFMQGAMPESSPNDETIYEYVKQTVYNSESIQTFLDTSKMSIPANIQESKEKISKNFDRFKGNYIAILLFCLLVFVIYRWETIPLMFLWGAYFYFSKKAEGSVNLWGINLEKHWIFRTCLIFTAFYLILAHSAIFSFMVVISFFMLFSISHMLLYQPEESSVV